MPRIGIDIGSTTIKITVVDESDRITYARYRRHRSDVRGELEALLSELHADLPALSAPVCLTGSAGLGVARALGLPFEQEVISATRAVQCFVPQADVVIELGGEDAKITFLKPTVSQRMNGTCAGGTGAFIDQMASLLMTDAQGLNDLAREYKHIFSIASRCGVFAKSDMQPLLNEGVSHSDLAASVLSAVVTQTVAGLACGQPITGTVVFLGGPLTFLPELRAAFERALAGQVESFVTPPNAEVFVAMGAAMGASGEAFSADALLYRLQDAGALEPDIVRLPRLFEDDSDRETFRVRHARAHVPRAPIGAAQGPCFLGIDAGSTTIKAALLSEDGRLLYSYYAPNQASPLLLAQGILREIYQKLPPSAYIGRACVTGYGEALLQVALRADEGEIETLSHVKAAQALNPNVDFILDIGGQDMKCIRLKDGLIDSILLNEACSSGCGSFLSTFAASLDMSLSAFSEAALGSGSPVDLGTRCTVFMNSRVKQAQKEGASPGDISAGLSYSVVRNALYKVIGVKSPDDLGQYPLVQGGTFLNDAVLRAFELISGREAVRPDIAGLMGAYGAAIIARERWEGAPSSLLKAGELDAALPEKTVTVPCRGCHNVCKLSVSTFSGARRLVSGHRCEKGQELGAPEAASKAKLPNLVQEKYERVFAYTPLAEEHAPRGVIGLPRALNMFENYPFWLSILTKLGFSVRLSRPSSHELFEAGMATIPSESVCYPAKLTHGHIQDLVDSGVKTIFYPSVLYERNESPDAGNHFNCPIVTSYPEVIGANMDVLGEKGIRFLHPFFSLEHRKKMPGILCDTFHDWGVTPAEARAAVEAGFAALLGFKEWIARRGAEVLEQLERENLYGLVLSGRPYHIDPEIHHGLPALAASLGFAVLTEDAVSDKAHVARPLRVFDQWMYHSRLYDAAAYVAQNPRLELVQLNSFGCGLDAITSDQVRDILSASGKTYTLLKIDEISHLGAARIRLRSLKVALDERARRAPVAQVFPGFAPEARVEFTPAMKKAHTVLAPQMSPVHFKLVEAVLQKSGYRCVVLENATPRDIELGLRYVNNDACYPSLVVVGQMLGALTSGQYDPDNTSIFLTQTGGGCRATNYVSLLRRALKDAGFPQVPVVGLSVSGIERHGGFAFTPELIDRAVRAIVLGDLLLQVLLRTRPYEQVPGAANALYERWLSRSMGYFKEEESLSYRGLIRKIVREFDALPLRDIPRKPRVGVVGEILVKFHPDANNNAVGVIEQEGCEAVVPGLLSFFQYCFLNTVIKHKTLGTPALPARLMALAVRLIERYEAPCRAALKSSRRFHVADRIHKLASRAKSVLSLSNQCGEGWLLTAEMLELIEAGAPNILCAQPFACLPNHVTGKGMIREIRRRFPHSNIVPVDYDPGASEVNQLNRIKLMIGAAMKNAAATE